MNQFVRRAMLSCSPRGHRCKPLLFSIAAIMLAILTGCGAGKAPLAPASEATTPAADSLGERVSSTLVSARTLPATCIKTSDQAHSGLLRNAPQEFAGMSLSESDVAALVAFLQSLTEDYDDA